MALAACFGVVAVLPIAAARAQDSTVTCTDGTTGHAGRGACSHHGGVAKAGSATTTASATAPAPAATPAATTTTDPAKGTRGPQVTCKDGTMGIGGQGGCSHHGGIAKMGAPAATTTAAPAPAPAKTAAAAPAAPPKTTPAATTTASAGSTKSETTDPTGAIAKCKDGLYSHSTHHTGTCSGHGGVAQWLDGSK
jgi:hypothetical protein